MADSAVGLLVPSSSCCRMKALSLLLLPVLGLLVNGKSLCPVDEAINEKIQDATSSLSKDFHIQSQRPLCFQTWSKGQVSLNLNPKQNSAPTHPNPNPNPK